MIIEYTNPTRQVKAKLAQELRKAKESLQITNSCIKDLVHNPKTVLYIDGGYSDQVKDYLAKKGEITYFDDDFETKAIDSREGYLWVLENPDSDGALYICHIYNDNLSELAQELAKELELELA